MKDHEKRELVNALTEVAVKYANTEQLRARIADLVLPALDATDAPTITDNTKTADEFGYKFAACLLCGNHDTPRCITCDIE